MSQYDFAVEILIPDIEIEVCFLDIFRLVLGENIAEKEINEFEDMSLQLLIILRVEISRYGLEEQVEIENKKIFVFSQRLLHHL